MSKTVLLTGPPGAGKTTAGKEFAKVAQGTWALVEQDAIRQLVKAGFKNPAEPWTKDTETQMNVSINICGDMARRYQQAGIHCLVDCFITLDPYVFDKWRAALEGVSYKIIVLLPQVQAALARNNQRTGDTRLADELVNNQHEEFSTWRQHPEAAIIDTTEMSVADVVQTIDNITNTK